MGHCRDRVTVPFCNPVGFILYLTLPLNSTLYNVGLGISATAFHFFNSPLAIGLVTPTPPIQFLSEK